MAGRKGSQTHMSLCCQLEARLGPAQSSGLASCSERPGPAPFPVLISVRFFL